MKFALAPVRHYRYIVAVCAPLSGCFDPLIEDPGANGGGQGADHGNTPWLGTPTVNPGMNVQPGPEPVAQPTAVTPSSATNPVPSSTVPVGATGGPTGATGGGPTGPTGASAGNPTGAETHDMGSVGHDAGTGDGGVGAFGDSTDADPTTNDSTSGQFGPTGAR